MKIIIPFKTPTINHLYWHRGNMKIMTKEAKMIREKIKSICSNLDSSELKEKKLRVYIEIYENWKTKKGEVKRIDVLNREKFLNDSIFEAIGIDDKFIFEQTFRKVQSNSEKAIIDICVLKD
jgi:Holliday junction resolvase RusA-like endonuclease